MAPLTCVKFLCNLKISFNIRSQRLAVGICVFIDSGKSIACVLDKKIGSQITSQSYHLDVATRISILDEHTKTWRDCASCLILCN